MSKPTSVPACQKVMRGVLLIAFLTPALLSRKPSGRGFKEKPRDQSVRVGEDVTFRCVADATISELSQWRHSSGVLLGPGTSLVIPGFHNRLSYLQESQSELHLHIKNVTLEDNGVFECQMVSKDLGPIRSTASLNVLVPPQQIYFENYDADQKVTVNEGSTLKVACVSKNAKPPGRVIWYVNGQEFKDNVERHEEFNNNDTVSTFATLNWIPSKKDHLKLMTCEVRHDETGVSERISLTMDVLYSSDRPVIEVKKQDETIRVGHNVSLVCVAEDGNPPPKLVWQLKERAIKSNYERDSSNHITRNVLSFVAEASDNGAIYVCASSNRETAPPLKSQVQLEVQYPPPTVNFVNVSTSVRYGDSISIACRSEPSNPAAAITWHMDGQPFVTAIPRNYIRTERGTASESVLTIDTQTLSSEIQQVIVDCTATNSEGSASKQHVVRIYSPPLPPLIRTSSPGPYLEGDLLNVTCEAVGGNPLATLTWYRGHMKLERAHGTVDGNRSKSTVQFQLDRTMNNMPIRCESVNPALDQPMNASVVLSVLFPPNRMEVREFESVSKEMIAGRDSRLKCIIPSSNPQAEVSWEIETEADQPMQLPGEPLRDEKSIENGGYEVENVVTFTPSVDMNGKKARCIASHPLWRNAKVQDYPLVVYYAPRFQANSTITISLSEGDRFKEEIAVLSNPSIVNYKWRKNGMSFNDSMGNVFVRNTLIGSRAIRPEDAGSYTLVVTNIIDSASITVRLEVRYGARITYIRSPIYADEGQQVVLECLADANPVRPKMTKWLKNGRDVTSVAEDKRAILRVRASKRDSGEYECVADNGVGQANRSTAHIFLNSPPVVVQQRATSRAAGPEAGQARARCVVRAVPDVRFFWSFADSEQEIKESAKFAIETRKLDPVTFESVLTISDLRPQDFRRTLHCRATNEKGSNSTKITLERPTRPDNPIGFKTLKTNSTSALVTWEPGFDGGSEQIFEIRYGKSGDSNARTVNTSESMYLLRHLESAKPYYLQVRAINLHGRTSDWSEWMQFRTLRENGTAYMGEPDDSILANNWIMFFLIVMAALLLLNCVVFAYIYTQHRRKLQAEKTQFVRQSNYGTECRPPLQLYGTIGNSGLSPAPFRRPESNNTNKSDLLNEPMSEDEQSQVSPNGALQRPNRPVNRFYDGNFVADEENDPSCYSAINKTGTLRSNYAPFKAPSYANATGSPSLTYADVGGSLRRGVDSPRRFGSVSGSINEDPRYGAYSGTLPRRVPPPSFTTFGGDPRIVGNPDGDLV